MVWEYSMRHTSISVMDTEDGWMDGRGPKKHMKRLAAPKHWMLDKLLGKLKIVNEEL
ncbi:hypothetical protein CU097_000482, partial [Rhizopus azygosporus]